MKILGIDPGTINTGFGVIQYKNNKLIYIASGTIKIPTTKNIALRLEVIYDEIDKLIKLHKPDQFSIETAFYGKNVQSAMKIGYARGVSLLAAAHNKIPNSEYAPREIKKAVVGKGAASKEQVQFMIQKLLNLPKEKNQFDETDALAAAVCHALKGSLPSASKNSWKSFIKENPDRIKE